ncbi:hypothetical protein RIF29_25766 [Crotalaria pallida]|uniref:Reverse transcriptase domain-containing protein n=1 Tax=Crotalaria pallida TaxID=3830 RepID=A0AAN9EMW2_CROPI
MEPPDPSIGIEHQITPMEEEDQLRLKASRKQEDLSRVYKIGLMCLYETHSGGDRAKRIINRLGFNGFYVVDAQGHAGGIWVLWDDNNWKVDVISSNYQLVHLKVQFHNCDPWLLTTVYGNPHPQYRHTLWENIREIEISVAGPWCLMGDFNSIIHDYEQSGGSSTFRSDSQTFNSMVRDCNLVDGGFVGYPFTWRRGRLLKRLDRVLMNLEWRITYPHMSVHHLDPLKSDHNPLLLDFATTGEVNRGRRPFRFMASWLSHKDLPKVISPLWDSKEQWNEKILSTKEGLKKWNIDEYGNIFKKKNQLLRLLNGISRSLAMGQNDYLENLQHILWKEYEQVIIDEEVLWFQKSRCKWIALGDRNTKYFHDTTLVRRRKNKIMSLLDDNDTWVTDRNQLECMARNYFQSLYADHTPYVEFCLHGAFPPLLQDQVNFLSKDVCNEEIKKAIFAMGGLKAPGKDGFQAIFYQSHWDIVGPALCNLVKDIFLHPDKVKDINDTLITLIPKINLPTSIKHFRPISLCNVSYKVVTKIIATRLRDIMDHVVGPSQCSFVPGRNGSDNIIVAQEVIHSMRAKKGKKGFMAIKIDLEKAYDKLKWNFVIDTLKDEGIPDMLINVIYHCISSATMNILWNGEILDPIIPANGVRQGDPISPYLFVLCMERLSHIINVAINHKFWKPIKLSRGGPLISHLAFADDLFLFAEVSLDQIDCITTCLDLFCESSGSKVNSDKTRIFFSKNVNNNIRQQICDACGFQRTDDLGKYLGIPLLHKE